MGNPTGEKHKSEASEQMICARAELSFQVRIIGFLGPGINY